MTPQRLAVVKILANSEEHLSAEKIYERVKCDFPFTSLATIYKTVTLLKKVGREWNLVSWMIATATMVLGRTLTHI